MRSFDLWGFQSDSGTLGRVLGTVSRVTMIKKSPIQLFNPEYQYREWATRAKSHIWTRFSIFSLEFAIFSSLPDTWELFWTGNEYQNYSVVIWNARNWLRWKFWVDLRKGEPLTSTSNPNQGGHQARTQIDWNLGFGPHFQHFPRFLHIFPASRMLESYSGAVMGIRTIQ